MLKPSTLKIAASLFLWCLVSAVIGFAAEGPVFGFGDSPAPWHIEADSFQSLGKNNYSARGKVVVTRGEKQVRADAIYFDGNKQNIVATGNVVMAAGQDVLRGDRMEMNLETQTGTIYGGELFLAKNHFYIAGDRIEKVGPDSYKVDRFKVTTCDPEDPDWHLSGRDLSVTIEGYGTMRHAAFWAGKIPVLYLPYLFFPVKTERQTGLLVPRMSYSHENGVEYAQPFFWAIDDSSDMTLFADYMSLRGVRLGTEYRRVFSEKSKMAVMFDGLNDRQENETAEDDYGYDGDAWLRPNSGRYWLRMKQDYVLPRGITSRLDIDVVSDQDYLREFDDAYMAFNETGAFFENFFGRDLDPADENVRTNSMSLNKRWTSYSVNAGLRWEDDVIKRRWEDTDLTVQRLPVVMFNAVRQAVPGVPLRYDLESEYTFCYRLDGPKGHRTDVHPRVYLPLHWRNILFLEPSAGIRETAWGMDEPDPSSPMMERTLTRTVYDMKLDLSSELYRIFSVNRKKDIGIKHTLLPRVVYDYVASPDEDEQFPVLNDTLDVIAEERLVTYSIENVFTMRTASAEGGTAPGEPGYRYREMGRLKIAQSYDIKEAREDNPAQWKNQTSRQPFSPISVELDLRPSNNMKVDMDASWDQYEHGWSTYDIEAALSDNRGDDIYVAYRYERDTAESVYAQAFLTLNRFLKLYGAYEYNFVDHINIETSVGCIYAADCWSLDLHYKEEPDDHKFSFMIRLNGLSDLKTAPGENRLDKIGN